MIQVVLCSHRLARDTSSSSMFALHRFWLRISPHLTARFGDARNKLRSFSFASPRPYHHETSQPSFTKGHQAAATKQVHSQLTRATAAVTSSFSSLGPAMPSPPSVRCSKDHRVCRQRRPRQPALQLNIVSTTWGRRGTCLAHGAVHGLGTSPGR